VILRKDDHLLRTLAASRRLKNVVGRHSARKKQTTALACAAVLPRLLFVLYCELTQKYVCVVIPEWSTQEIFTYLCGQLHVRPRIMCTNSRFHKEFSWIKSCYCDMVSGYALWISNYWSSLWS